MIRVSSFIFSFRRVYSKYGKNVKRIGFLLLFAFVFRAGVAFFNYIYAGYDEWCRILWHNYYNEEENIDYLYLGSSHVYCDINPFKLDKLNGENNFNLSSSSQKLNGSYHLLKEADKRHDIKHVYLEMYYVQSTGSGGIYYDSGNVGANQNTINFMKISGNKLHYMLTMSEPSLYGETLFPFIKYRSQLFNYIYIKDTIDKKETDDYKNYIYSTKNDGDILYYADKGFYYRTRQRWTGEYRMEKNPMTDDAEKYLKKIIKYCQNNGIGITLFSSPIYELQVLSTENYDNYVSQLRQIAEEYGIDYYDFNLCRENYLPIQKTENFMDIGHLNVNGADIYTDMFWKVMSGTPEENEKYFYPTYAEKLLSSKPQIYGIHQVDFDGTDVGIDAAAYKVAANRPQDMEYRILLTVEDEGTRMYQDFSSNPYLSVPSSEHGICTIVARVKGQEEKVQTLEINY